MLRVVDELDEPLPQRRTWPGLWPRLAALGVALAASTKDSRLLVALGMVAVLLGVQFLLTAVCTSDLRRAAAGDEPGLE